MIGSALYFFQEKLLFLPTTLPQDHVFTFDHPFEEHYLKTEDGAVINTLHFKALNREGAIFYLHGNAGDLQRWGTIVSYLVDLNYDVYILDYRTYGKSTGILNESAMYADAQMAYDHLKESVSEENIIIYGRSLGTGMATYLASNNKPSKLILETPYYSIADVAKHRFPIFPVSRLLKYKFPSNEYIKEVNCEIIIFHGTDDLVVPFSSGEKLFKVSDKQKTRFITIEGGTHNDLVTFDNYHDQLNLFLKQ